MSLIHYYKFNGNLYDSVGAFDLITDVGTASYTSGILGGMTGAVTPDMMAMGMWGAYGTGAAVSGFLAADLTEAAAGVTEWSLTFWAYIGTGGYSDVPIVSLLTSTSGQTACNFIYSGMMGVFSGAGLSVSISTGSWQFISIVKSGTNIYISLNAGSPVSGSFTTGSGTSGKTQFNGIRCGLPTGSGTLNGLKLDDLRMYNHALTSGELASIYNGGSPTEASSSPLIWDQPIHHYKFNNNLNDSIGSDNAMAFYANSYVSGLFVNSPNSARTAYPNYIQTTSSYDWAPNSWAVSVWLDPSVSGVSSQIFIVYLSGNQIYLNWNASLSNYNFSDGYGSFGVPFVFASNSPIMISYSHIAQRLVFLNGMTQNIVFQAPSVWTALRGFLSGSASASATVTIDDARFFNSALSGFDWLQIFNSGSGTEYSVASGAGSASGGLATVTISAFSGTASGTGGGPGSASGSLPVITMSGPVGSAGVNGSASGLLSTVTITSFSGIGFPEFIATGSLPIISIVPFEAVASISTSIQLSYVSCDAEIAWKQSLSITGFASAIQGDDAISAKITPIVSGIDANIVFFEQRTLTASSSYIYDLRALTDFLGQPFSLSRAYAISLVMISGSATISPGISNPLQWFFNSTTANVTITSGNSFLFAQKSSAIVNSSAKTILVSNPSGLSACVYKIVILGGR